MSRWYLLVIVLMVVVFVPQADAREVTDIGIVLSKKCIILIQNNINQNCPTYEQLLIVFPDTSPREHIGGFDYVDGMFQRVPIPTNIERCRNYIQGLTDVVRLWIDPPGCIRPYIKLITIESNFLDYPIEKVSYDMKNNTIIVGNKRWVDYGCTQSMINAADWLFLGGDTMQLMHHNCDPKFTNFNHIKKYQFEKPYHDLATSNKWKLDEFMKLALTKYKLKSFIGTDDTMENRAVTTDENER